MLHALNAKKINDRRIIGDGLKEPREDLITSAIFGTLEFLPEDDRRQIWSLIVGEPLHGPIEVFLWPRFYVAPGCVEPDILLVERSDPVDRFRIIEIKWGAPLGENQILGTLANVRGGQCRVPGLDMRGGPVRSVISYVLVGRRECHSSDLAKAELCGETVRALSWAEIVQMLRGLSRTSSRPPLAKWLATTCQFLLSTREGDTLHSWPRVAEVPPSQFQFPFLDEYKLRPVSTMRFRFGDGNE